MEIQTAINQKITAGMLPPWGPSELFMVFLPPGVMLGPADAPGLHSDNYTYSLIPDPKTGLLDYHDYFFAAVASSDTSLENTVVASHELAEAVTDPRLNGWFNDQAMMNGEGEVADLATPNTGIVGGYQVTQLWSNADGRIIVPGSTGTPPAPTTDQPNSTVATSAPASTPTPTPTPTSTSAPTPTPTVPPAVAPAFVGEMRLTTKSGKQHKKMTLYQLHFSGPLNPTVAQNTVLYEVEQVVSQGKKGVKMRPITVKSAVYSAANNSVTLTLGMHVNNKPLKLSAAGLQGTNGTTVAPIESDL
jgi:hypothetical protein